MSIHITVPSGKGPPCSWISSKIARERSG
jgi:hypothetical protein